MLPAMLSLRRKSKNTQVHVGMLIAVTTWLHVYVPVPLFVCSSSGKRAAVLRSKPLNCNVFRFYVFEVGSMHSMATCAPNDWHQGTGMCKQIAVQTEHWIKDNAPLLSEYTPNLHVGDHGCWVASKPSKLLARWVHG